MFQQKDLKFSRGIHLKNWLAHNTNLRDQYGYKTLEILTQLNTLPRGSRINFFGDDKEHDAEIYLSIKDLNQRKFSPEQFAELIQTKKRIELPQYTQESIAQLAKSVLSKGHRIDDVLIRQCRPDQKLLNPNEEKRVIYFEDGHSAAIHLLFTGALRYSSFKEQFLQSEESILKIKSAIEYWLANHSFQYLTNDTQDSIIRYADGLRSVIADLLPSPSAPSPPLE